MAWSTCQPECRWLSRIEPIIVVVAVVEGGFGRKSGRES
jgi:hypothetical protein